MPPSSLLALDHLLRLWIVAHRVAFLNPVMRALSVVGRGGLVWLVLGAVLTMARSVRPRGLVQLMLAVIFASVVTDRIVKPFVGRERPYVSTPTIQVLGNPPDDASFPSGHSANAFAGASVLSRLVPALSIWWWILAIAIAYSRVYLGVHYPLDVTGGAVVGVVAGLLVMRVTRSWGVGAEKAES